MKINVKKGNNMNLDATIFNDITWKLNNDPRIDSKNITVSVKDKIVTFTGTVKKFYEKGYIEEDAKSVHGVLGVVEELEVSFYDFTPPTDAKIAKAVLEALGWDVMFGTNKHHFQVVVEKGVLTLTGEVNYHFQKERAVENARYVRGVKSIINKISVKPDLTPEKVKEKITEGFVNSARLDGKSIDVEVDGSIVTLKGKVHSWFEHEEARKIAYLVPGVIKVNNLIHL